MEKRIGKTIEELSEISESGEGVTRLPLTSCGKKGADYLFFYMEQAGLTVTVDPTGAVRGRYDSEEACTGVKRDKPWVLTGSHMDSVCFGGAFDGIAGIVAAVEAVRSIREKKIVLPFGIEVIATNDEEGVRFTRGFLTSKAMCQGISPEEMEEIRDRKTGETLKEALESYGSSPKAVSDMAGTIRQYQSFLEVHIEQGPILWKQNKELGIVTGIAGIRRYTLTAKGEANHAGSTPMEYRKDALTAAAQVILWIQEKAKKTEGIRGTVGSLTVKPGMINAIPGEVSFTLDLRLEENTKGDWLESELQWKLQEIEEKTGILWKVEKTLEQREVLMEKTMLQKIEQGITQEGISYGKLFSGAGHDAQVIGQMIPTGMIFLPSLGGLSHTPAEETKIASIVTGAKVLERIWLNQKGEMR